MWHVLYYKATPKARKWTFHSMSGDKAYMEEIKQGLDDQGYKTRLSEQEA